MKVINLKELKAFPYSQREKNVLFEDNKCKLRIIELKAGESIPECIMNGTVIFHVFSGSGELSVNGESVKIRKGDVSIGFKGSFSMKTSRGMKLTGVIVK
ncbi:MAG: cupin domain-containing protein [bacterium]